MRMLDNSKGAALLAVAGLSALSLVKLMQPTLANTLDEGTRLAPLYLAQDSQGVVEGTLSYPSDILPAMRVCAQSTSNVYLMSCIDTEEDQGSFEMSLNPGEYYFFSYMLWPDAEQFIFHSIGGFRVDTSHAPQAESVVAGQTTRGIAINNPRTCEEYAQYCVTPPQ